MVAIDSYIRVSKKGDREGDRFISPSEQAAANRGWADSNDFTIAREAAEISVSGARADRPELLRSIERIEQGLIAGIVVAKLDRFFRSQLDGLLAVKRIREADGFFVSADGEIDIRDEAGDLVLGIRLAIAEDERRRRKADFAAGRRRAVERGIHPTSVVNYGYQRPEDDKGHITGPNEPDPETAPYMTEMIERAGRLDTWTSISRWLNDSGQRTVHGKSPCVAIMAWQALDPTRGQALRPQSRLPRRGQARRVREGRCSSAAHRRDHLA